MRLYSSSAAVICWYLIIVAFCVVLPVLCGHDLASLLRAYGRIKSQCSPSCPSSLLLVFNSYLCVLQLQLLQSLCGIIHNTFLYSLYKTTSRLIISQFLHSTGSYGDQFLIKAIKKQEVFIEIEVFDGFRFTSSPLSV